jgi:hypothetical protein
MRRFFSSSGTEKRRCDQRVGNKDAISQPKGGSPEYTYHQQADSLSESRFHDRVRDEERYYNQEHALIGKTRKSLRRIDRAGKHCSRYRQERGRQKRK